MRRDLKKLENHGLKTSNDVDKLARYMARINNEQDKITCLKMLLSIKNETDLLRFVCLIKQKKNM